MYNLFLRNHFITLKKYSIYKSNLQNPIECITFEQLTKINIVKYTTNNFGFKYDYIGAL